MHVVASIASFEHLEANAWEDEQLPEVGELVRDSRGGRSAPRRGRALFHPVQFIQPTSTNTFKCPIHPMNAPGWETVKAVIVGSTEGGHDVVHLLAVRLQRLPLRHHVRVLPNLVQPEKFPGLCIFAFLEATASIDSW